MSTPRLIASTAFKGGPPRAPRVTMKDMPSNSEVHTPGSKHYRGGRRGSTLTDEDRGILRGAAIRTNERNARATNLRARPNADQVVGGITVATAAGLPVGAAIAVPEARRQQRAKATVLRRKNAAIAKGIFKPKVNWAKGPHSVDDDGLMRAAVRGKDGAHGVTSAGDHTIFNPSRRARVRQQAGRVAQKVGRSENLQSAAIGAGGLAGIGVIVGGTTNSRHDLQSAQRERASALRARRKTARGQLTPVTKGLQPRLIGNAIRHPSEMRRVIRENPWEAGIALGGAGLAGAAGARDKKHPGRTAAAGIGGAAAGQGAYYGVGFGAVANAKRLKHKGQKQGHNGLSRSAQESIWRNHRKGHGVRQGQPMTTAQQRAVFQGYPEKLPGWRSQRLAAHMQRGKYGRLINAGVTLGGAAMVGGASAHGRKQSVGKALYAREDRVSIIRAGELAAGGTLAVYGLGNSGMVGRGISRGVKIAQRNGNDQAVIALQRAQAARGSIRVGMAPGEAALRRIHAVDSAIRKVPKPLRAEVALVAGALLGARALPVRRTHYTPVSTPVPAYGGRW